MENSEKLLKKNMHLTFAEISHEMSQLWKDLPVSKKKKYLKLSVEDKKRYASDKSA
jgi:hypothetical protein